jgi:hypothetical protein
MHNDVRPGVSTGPRTPEGKARSSQNARKHGLTAREVLITEKEREEFEEFLAAYQADLRPQGMLEQDLFNQLVHAAWNLRRIRLYEAQAVHDPLNTHVISAQIINRYHARIERTYHRCLKELKALQTNRALREDFDAAHPDRRDPPPLTALPEWTKRTLRPLRPGLLDGEEVIWHCYPGPLIAPKQVETPPEPPLEAPPEAA